MNRDDLEGRKHQATLLARDVRNAEQNRDKAAQEVEETKAALAALKARLPVVRADLVAAEQGVLDAQAARTRWTEEQTLEFRLRKAGEEQAAAVRRAKEREGAAQQNLIRAQEEKIAAAEGLAAVLGKELT
jgi:chromosome segregation ATPase